MGRLCEVLKPTHMMGCLSPRPTNPPPHDASLSLSLSLSAGGRSPIHPPPTDEYQSRMHSSGYVGLAGQRNNGSVASGRAGARQPVCLLSIPLLRFGFGNRGSLFCMLDALKSVPAIPQRSVVYVRTTRPSPGKRFPRNISPTNKCSSSSNSSNSSNTPGRMVMPAQSGPTPPLQRHRPLPEWESAWSPSSRRCAFAAPR